MTYLDFLEQKVLLERLVIGLEEPVLIKGLGELSAKIDSGNGGYNVIHGTDFHQQGSELMFTTHDSFGHQKKIQAKVIDTIEVNMGGGNIENRPVIELDLKFAGEDYKKIPFSVSDRSTNTNPILISKGFVEKELEALIDVGKKNISQDGIDVVYGEGFQFFKGRNIKNGWKKGVDSGKGVTGWFKKVGSGIANVAKGVNKFMAGGNDVNPLKPVGALLGGTISLLGGTLGVLVGFARTIKYLPKIVQDDISKIRTKLPASPVAKKLQNQDSNIKDTIWNQYDKANFKDTPIFTILSFKGRKCDFNDGNIVSGMQARVKMWKDAMEKAQAKIEEEKNSKGGEASTQANTTQKPQEQQQEVIFSEALSLLEDMAAMYYADKANHSTPTSSTSTKPTQGAQQPTQPTNNTAITNPQKTQAQENQQKHDKDVDGDLNNIEETTTELKGLNNFVLYFVPTRLETKKNTGEFTGKIKGDTAAENFIYKELQTGKFDKIFIKFFGQGHMKADFGREIVKVLAKEFRNIILTNKHYGDLFQGMFVLVVGDEGGREVHIYDNPNEVAYRVDTKKQEQREKTIKDIGQKLAIIAPTLSDDILRTSSISNPQIINFLSPQGKEIANEYIQTQKGYTKGIGQPEREVLNNIIAPIRRTGELQSAIIKLSLSQSEKGKEVLTALGDFDKVKSLEDFIKLCSQNEKVKEVLSQVSPKESNSTKDVPQTNQVKPQEQSDEEPVEDQKEKWVREKMKLLKNKGII